MPAAMGWQAGGKRGERGEGERATKRARINHKKGGVNSAKRKGRKGWVSKHGGVGAGRGAGKRGGDVSACVHHPAAA